MRTSEHLAFAGGGLDRAALRRRDRAWMADALAGGRVLPVWQGKPLMSEGGLGWLSADHPALAGAEADPGPVFLGLYGGVARFALDLSHWQPAPDQAAVVPGFADPTEQRHPATGENLAFVELRGAMLRLSAAEGELAAAARAVLGWHRSHRFCAACGTRSGATDGGWQRLCPDCGAHHFPRTDPVVIMHVTHGNRALVGRSPGWPPGMYSCLAGFVEPGETVENAVRREVAEEAGLRIGRVRYAASQPWPFPSSLMLGCRAVALDDAITLDPAELEDARWIGREDMVAVMAGDHPAIRPARRGSIAHALLRAWLAGDPD